MPSTTSAASSAVPFLSTRRHNGGPALRPAGGRRRTSPALAPLLPATTSTGRRGGSDCVARATVVHQSHSHAEDEMELMAMTIQTVPQPSGHARHQHHLGHSRHHHQQQHQQQHDHEEQHHDHHHGRHAQRHSSGAAPAVRSTPRPTGVLRLGPTSDTVRIMSQLRDAVLRQGSAVLLVHDGAAALEDAVDVLVLLSEDVQAAEPGCIAVFQPILSRYSPTCPPPSSNGCGGGGFAGGSSSSASCDLHYGPQRAGGATGGQHGSGHFSGGHGYGQQAGEGHWHAGGNGAGSGASADFALLVSKVPATITTPRRPNSANGGLPLCAGTDSDCLHLADQVTVQLSHSGCSTRVRCSHSGRALSTMLRAVVCARRRLRSGVAGGGDIVVEPQVVFEVDEHNGDSAALYLNIWRLGH